MSLLLVFFPCPVAYKVMLEASDNATTGGGQYARILENRFGNVFIQCLNSDITEFKTTYFQGVCR